MNTLSAVLVAWAIFLMGLNFGQTSSSHHKRIKETGPIKDWKVDKRVLFSPRILQLRELAKQATGLNDTTVNAIYNYGCWCGPRGEGKIVDNFDYCCKVHDFCEVGVLRDECSGLDGEGFFAKEFLHDKFQCSPLSAYTDTTNEKEKRCRHANCLCDLELVRCMRNYKEEFTTDNIGFVVPQGRSCALPETTLRGDSCKTKADVIILIQDSELISTTTVNNIKTVVRRLLTNLESQAQDYSFALSIYARSRRMSCFGNATETTSYMDREYIHGRRDNKNLLKRALEEMIKRQFNGRRDDRQGADTVKILVMLVDGNAERGNGRVVDTYELEQTARKLRDDNSIKMVGALIPNTENTQRISQLKGIVTLPDDGIALNPGDLDETADQLAERVQRLVCQARYAVQIFTPDTQVGREFRFFITVKGQGNLATTYQVMTETSEEMQGGQLVINGEFFAIDVGTIVEVGILPDRVVDALGTWDLNQVKVTKGELTVTAVFNRVVPRYPYIPFTANATPDEPMEE
ncbi:uncharacterized protein LOC144644554 [Oculina patagonica]